MFCPDIKAECRHDCRDWRNDAVIELESGTNVIGACVKTLLDELDQNGRLDQNEFRERNARKYEIKYI